MEKTNHRYKLYKLNIRKLLDALVELDKEGYEFMDMKVSNSVSDQKKYSTLIELFPLQREKRIKSNDLYIPQRKLTIEELLKYHS